MNRGLGRGGCRRRWRRRRELRLSGARGLLGGGVAARKSWRWRMLWIRILKVGVVGQQGLQWESTRGAFFRAPTYLHLTRRSTR